jgi:hypothetical protein
MGCRLARDGARTGLRIGASGIAMAALVTATAAPQRTVGRGDGRQGRPRLAEQQSKGWHPFSLGVESVGMARQGVTFGAGF